MAKLGVRTVDELVGRTDLLKVAPAPGRLRAASEMDLTGASAEPADREQQRATLTRRLSTTSSWSRRRDMKVLLKKFKQGP